MKKIPYGRQCISPDDIEAVTTALGADLITQGEIVPEFERQFAAYFDVKYAVAVNSGTAALHLACLALGIGSEHVVATSPITFAASMNCAQYCGASSTFIDICPDTFCLSIEALKLRLEENPSSIKAVVVVHFAGYPVDMPSLFALSEEYGFFIIEDTCHAPGASRESADGSFFRCGDCSYSHASTFSFHPVKHMTTGEGGMFLTNDIELYRRAVRFRSHGITKDPKELSENHGKWYYEMHELGYNYRITDFQAALGISQLTRLEQGNARRREIAQQYNQGLARLPLKSQKIEAGVKHAFHLYVVLTPLRDQLYDYLHQRGILTQVHYIPVNSMPYYKRLGHSCEDTPHALSYYNQCLSLPMYPTLSELDVDHVIKVLHEFFASH
jgi:UDP-4-amino-4,6-dideoxy-N-acetyl-beta-L-altrosamine transaminase